MPLNYKRFEQITLLISQVHDKHGENSEFSKVKKASLLWASENKFWTWSILSLYEKLGDRGLTSNSLSLKPRDGQRGPELLTLGYMINVLFDLGHHIPTQPYSQRRIFCELRSTMLLSAKPVRVILFRPLNGCYQSDLGQMYCLVAPVINIIS